MVVSNLLTVSGGGGVVVSNFMTVSEGGGVVVFNLLTLADGGGWVGKYLQIFLTKCAHFSYFAHPQPQATC